MSTPTIFYVKSTAPSGGNGSSWTNAFNNLDSALLAAAISSGSDQIWVAKGTYTPSIKYGGGYSGNESNLVTFNLPSNVSIYGGFNGDETKLNQRKPNQYITILDGQLAGTDKAWHVLTADGITNVIVDGFTIQNGDASGPDQGIVIFQDSSSVVTDIDYAHDNGGGLIARHGAHITLNNNKFKNNSSNNINATMLTLIPPIIPIIGGGGAISSMDINTLVTITACTFTNNTAISLGNNGGALNTVFEGSFSVSASTFSNNSCDQVGGAIHGRAGGNISVNACSLNNNKITSNLLGIESGGCIGVINTNVSVVNSTFNGNLGDPSFGGGGAIFFHSPFDDGDAYTLVVSNSTFVNNKGSDFGGGGILIFGIKTNIGTIATISNCTFSGNVGGIGGGIYIDSIATTVTNSTFINNKAWVEGGAIFQSNFSDAIFDITSFNDRKLLTVTNSTFSGNSIIGIPPTAVPPFAIFGGLAAGIAFGFGLPPAGVISMAAGGGAIASVFGGKISITNSVFTGNSASAGNGGALLIGGTHGFSGTSNLGMNQGYITIFTSIGTGNSDQTGSNNKAVIDPAGLGNNQNGVQFVTDGSFN